MMLLRLLYLCRSKRFIIFIFYFYFFNFFIRTCLVLLTILKYYKKIYRVKYVLVCMAIENCDGNKWYGLLRKF